MVYCFCHVIMVLIDLVVDGPLVPTSILIADDHPLFRAAMCHALNSSDNLTLMESSTFPETMDVLANNAHIDIVFLDLGMPGTEGLNGLSEVRAEYPDVLVVIVTAQDAPDIVQCALTLGASGFIPKSASVDCIVEAVSTVLDGETWLPEHIGATLTLRDNVDDFSMRLAQLTPHQLKVLKMVSDGLLNKQIAYELAISESTVKQHVSAVLKKLGVINRTKAGIAFKNTMRTDS